MTKLILPVAGHSSRFPKMKPKWLLTHPNSNLMFHESIRGLEGKDIEKIFIVCRRDHFEQYGVDRLVAKQFEVSELKVPYKIVVVPDTQSQPETVARAIEQEGIDGPILIKDSDNFFRAKVGAGNCVMTMNLNQLPSVDAANKSYVELDDRGRVLNIVEKHVISNTFCVGGYGFASAKEFFDTYQALSKTPNLYVSHVIYKMLLEGHSFEGINASDFLDWGTLREWNRFKRTFATLFVDLDGILVKNSGQFSDPAWGETSGIRPNIEAVNKLADTGRVQIVLTTSRKRTYAEKTEAQLKAEGIRYHSIVYDLPHARRILINDYNDTNPYKAADSINLLRDTTELGHMLSDLFESLQ